MQPGYRSRPRANIGLAVARVGRRTVAKPLQAVDAITRSKLRLSGGSPHVTVWTTPYQQQFVRSSPAGLTIF